MAFNCYFILGYTHLLFIYWNKFSSLHSFNKFFLKCVCIQIIYYVNQLLNLSKIYCLKNAHSSQDFKWWQPVEIAEDFIGCSGSCSICLSSGPYQNPSCRYTDELYDITSILSNHICRPFQKKSVLVHKNHCKHAVASLASPRHMDPIIKC